MTAVAAQQTVLDQLRATVGQQGAVIQAQARELAAQRQQIAMIARLAGITDEIAKVADVNNPAQPWPDPASQAATETTEQAVTPATYDDVRSPGQTPGSTSGVPAAATDVAINPGGTLPTQPYTNLVDVTAPTVGTQPGELSPEQTRIETDVRVGDPMQPEVAFPWTISENRSNSAPPSDGEMGQGARHAALEGRFAASLRLARLRINAGLASGDDISLAASIQSDTGMTGEVIEHEIRTLDGVVKAASRVPSPEAVPRRSASTRTAPSMASAPMPLSPEGSSVDDSMLFLSASDLAGL